MKKILLFITMFTFIGMMSVVGQSTLIIEENFQEWEETETTEPDTCWVGNLTEFENTREITLETSTGYIDIPVTLVQVVIMPECNSRRVQRADPLGSVENLPGVTTGWVQLNKLADEYNKMSNFEESADTLGELIFGPIPQIDSIYFAHSATGSNRGIRVYKSTDGENWENASPDDEFWDGADCQLGDSNVVVIDEEEVYIKFTSGFKQSDSTSQFTRLHNFRVYGEPGDVEAIENITKNELFSSYPVPTDDFVIIKLAEEAFGSELKILDVLGKTIYRGVVNQQTSSIDISHLNSGMYFIQLIHNDNKYINQLVVK